jgi:hypothetical protein
LLWRTAVSASKLDAGRACPAGAVKAKGRQR